MKRQQFILLWRIGLLPRAWFSLDARTAIMSGVSIFLMAQERLAHVTEVFHSEAVLEIRLFTLVGFQKVVIQFGKAQFFIWC